MMIPQVFLHPPRTLAVLPDGTQRRKPGQATQFWQAPRRSLRPEIKGDWWVHGGLIVGDIVVNNVVLYAFLRG